jgi:hypothetical protein
MPEFTSEAKSFGSMRSAFREMHERLVEAPLLQQRMPEVVANQEIRAGNGKGARE